MSRQKDFDDRPPSEQLVDLVVYVVPAELWKERLHSAFSDVINETVSAGFLRVHPETPVAHLREEIQIQLEDEYDLPQEYVFVKNVGRRLTKVRKKQEMQLKVKNFIDPQSYACEIFLLEGGSDTQSIHPSSVSSSYRGEPTTQEDPYHLDSYRSKGTFASQKPVPPIKPGQATSTNTSRAYPAKSAAFSPPDSSVRTSRQSLTNSNTSFNSVQSQTDNISAYSSHSLHSHVSTTGAKAGPIVSNHPSSKTVTFDHPQERQNTPQDYNYHQQSHYYHRPPTPGTIEEPLGISTDRATQWSRQNSRLLSPSPHPSLPSTPLSSQNNDPYHNNYTNPPANPEEEPFETFVNQATQWSRQNSRAMLISPRPPSSNQKHSYNNHRSTANHSGQNGDPGYEDDAPTPPPLSATPTQGLSPYPTTARPGSDGGGDKRGRQKEYLPPLSCTPPPTSPGSQVRPRMKTSADKDAQNRTKHESGSSDGKENNLPHHANDRWEDRNGYLNRSNSYLKREELARQKQEEEARRRQQQEEEMRRRQQEEEARKRQGEEEEMRRRKQEEEARRRREEQQRLRDEENRRKQREQNDRNERQRMEEEARRRREEEEEAERRRRQEEEEQRRREEEEKDRLNAEAQRNDQSDHETQKQTLLEELEKLKQERASTEKEREELVRKAKQLQSRTQNRRNQARDIWKKKYFEEKKKTPPLEEQCGKLRQDLDAIHKRIVNSLEGNKEREGRRGAPLEKPSPESNVKIQATRLQHEIEDLQRRVETIKMKLTAEMKLRNQAENELRALRAELTQKKINVTLSRRGQREDNPDLYTPRSQQPISSRT